MRALYVIGPPMLTAGVVLLVLLGCCQGSDPVGSDLLMRDLFPPEADPSRCALSVHGVGPGAIGGLTRWLT